MHRLLNLIVIFWVSSIQASVVPGIEVLLTVQHQKEIAGKRVGLITNHTGVTREMDSSVELLKANQSKWGYKLAALFAPEHGIDGAGHAWDHIHDRVDASGIPIFSLHGTTRRPTEEMLKAVDVIVYDIQDIGSRSYTYISTLFYTMEEAAKYKIPVIVADRPNPINGLTVDGPMMEDKWRSMVGYINVPYCHGMTVGELAQLFNEEYKIGCKLTVVPMSGWKRQMTFSDTGLPWIPTSPNIPEPSTPYYYPMTGILGELQIVSIGIGYPLPFKVLGAPWIDAPTFAAKLNTQGLPGVRFQPYYFKPFYGKYKHESCQGVLIVVNDHKKFKPVTTQFVIMGLLKSLYPNEFLKALKGAKNREEMFAKVNGTAAVFQILKEKPYVAWELRGFQQKEREAFLKKRNRYLIKSYS